MNLDLADRKKAQTAVGRIFFLLNAILTLKPGGRMAIVLPQGRFNNPSDIQIRNFISEHEIIAVIGLSPNTFNPHASGIKTNVLFFQKWHEKHCQNWTIQSSSQFLKEWKR